MKVSGTHPGRLSLKRFGVFGCVGPGSNAQQWIYDTVQVGQPETQNVFLKKYGDNQSFVEVSFAPELGGRNLGQFHAHVPSRRASGPLRKQKGRQNTSAGRHTSIGADAKHASEAPLAPQQHSSVAQAAGKYTPTNHHTQ